MVLDMKISKNISTYTFQRGAFLSLVDLLSSKIQDSAEGVLFLVDDYFSTRPLDLPHRSSQDLVFFVPTDEEPTTEFIDTLMVRIRKELKAHPGAVVGIGGGITLDTAKAISILLTNAGKAEDYQGWDLVRVPGIYKIGIPTISGTGAESSRTCVLINKAKNIKLGMNSHYSYFDHLILDLEFSATVPRQQFFYTGMDSYIHCVESLKGRFRHALADAYSHQTLTLCREVFSSGDMMADGNRELLMVASYFGGISIANTFVGVVHPISAGLSTVLGLHHCIANCIVMNVMEEFYPQEVAEFHEFLKRQEISLPLGITRQLSVDQFEDLYQSAIIHEKPLMNAFGADYKEILTREKVISIYKRM